MGDVITDRSNSVGCILSTVVGYPSSDIRISISKIIGMLRLVCTYT